MQLINNFDIESDFYSDPQLELIFQQEKVNGITSKEMWALMLYFHPKSKYAGLDHTSKLELISTDYLKQPLKLDSYKDTIKKIETFLLTKVEYLLSNWERKLEERDEFIHSKPYDEDTYEMLDKMMASTAKMWEQYLSIRKKAIQEEEAQTEGDSELSLSEKGII